MAVTKLPPNQFYAEKRHYSQAKTITIGLVQVFIFGLTAQNEHLSGLRIVKSAAPERWESHLY